MNNEHDPMMRAKEWNEKWDKAIAEKKVTLADKYDRMCSKIFDRLYAQTLPLEKSDAEARE